MEGALLHLSCFIIFNITWDFFLDILSVVRLRSLVVLTSEVLFFADGNIVTGEGGYAPMFT